MHDISERKESRGQAARACDDVEALADAVAELARSTVSREARAAVCRAAARIAEADVGALIEPDSSGTGLVNHRLGGHRHRRRVRPLHRERRVGQELQHARAVFRRRRGGQQSGPAVAASVIMASSRRSGSRSSRTTNAIGVIAVGWKQPVPAVPARLAAAPRHDRAPRPPSRSSGQRLLDRLELLAHTDDLTGLINRRAWDLDVVREVARARRDDLPLAVAMIDLDRFKTYNDGTATRPAIGCCARRPAPGAPCSGRRTCSPATAARSSRSRFPAASARTHSSWSSGSAT